MVPHGLPRGLLVSGSGDVLGFPSQFGFPSPTRETEFARETESFCESSILPLRIWPRSVAPEALQTDSICFMQVGSLGVIHASNALPASVSGNDVQWTRKPESTREPEWFGKIM